jgi:hypothetical protein
MYPSPDLFLLDQILLITSLRALLLTVSSRTLDRPSPNFPGKATIFLHLLKCLQI